MQVCSGATGHAEAVQFEYDPSKAKFEDLVSSPLIPYLLMYSSMQPSCLRNWQGLLLAKQFPQYVFASFCPLDVCIWPEPGLSSGIPACVHLAI